MGTVRTGGEMTWPKWVEKDAGNVAVRKQGMSTDSRRWWSTDEGRLTARLHVDESSVEDLLEEDLQKLVLVPCLRLCGNLRVREVFGAILQTD